MRNAMSYSLKEAAEATGKSKPTILRAIQGGKVSAARDANNEWQIEPAELHRVYPPVTERTVTRTSPFNDTQHPNSAFEMGVLSGEVELLREQLTSMNIDRERERREASDQINDLRHRLDQSEAERRTTATQLNALLTDASKPAAPTPPEASQAASSPAPVSGPAAETTATAAPAGLWSKIRHAVGKKP